MEETEWAPENDQEEHSKTSSDFSKDGDSFHSTNSNTDSEASPSQQSVNSPTSPPNIERDDRTKINEISQITEALSNQTSENSQTRQEATSIINELARNKNQTFHSQGLTMQEEVVGLT
jgi:hypothetical protein